MPNFSLYYYIQASQHAALAALSKGREYVAERVRELEGEVIKAIIDLPWTIRGTTEGLHPSALC